MNQSSIFCESSPKQGLTKDLFSENWGWQAQWAMSIQSDALQVRATSQMKVGTGVVGKEGSDCKLRGKHIPCCYILPVEEDLSLCQAGNSKCLALKVFPIPTSAMGEETAASKGLWGLRV